MTHIDTTQPLEAAVYATLFDVGGRPVKRNLTIPIETRSLVIGIKPNFPPKWTPVRRRKCCQPNRA